MNARAAIIWGSLFFGIAYMAGATLSAALFLGLISGAISGLISFPKQYGWATHFKQHLYPYNPYSYNSYPYTAKHHHVIHAPTTPPTYLHHHVIPTATPSYSKCWFPSGRNRVTPSTYGFRTTNGVSYMETSYHGTPVKFTRKVIN